MTGHERRHGRNPTIPRPALAKRLEVGNRCGKQSGLRVLGQVQGLLGPGPGEFRDVLTEGRIGGAKDRCRRGRRGGQRPAHADGLRALSGKDERDLVHGLLLELGWARRDPTTAAGNPILPQLLVG